LDRRRKIAAFAGGFAVFCVILLIAIIAVRSRRIKRRPITIQGSVIVHNVDTKKESPIADVEISAARKTGSNFFNSPPLHTLDFSGRKT